MTKKTTYKFLQFLLLVFLCMLMKPAAAQQEDSLSRIIVEDSLYKVADTLNSKKIDSVLAVHSPRKATIRSAILPGWGQAYNKKYWKIPIVYGALGTTAGLFFYNLTNYRELRFAYQVKRGDSTNYNRIKNKQLLDLEEESLRFNRNEFRRNVDYSVLFFLVAWGLNVVDATVDAHLKSFDVSPDLGFNIKAGYSPLAETNGISLILAFK